MVSVLAGRRIVVAVTGGIAAYKTCALVSKLAQAGAQVRVVMTAAAQRFVSELTMATLSGQPVATDMWADRDEMAHISLADFAEAVIVAPATANIIGKLAHGIADDLLSTALLAFTCPIVVAPAMNTRMLDNPAVQANLQLLRERGIMVLEPAEGRLACGECGRGRLPETEELIAALIEALGADGPLAGRRVVITAGPTREALDPVRFLSNPSSGKMGYALAAAARRRGAEVTLISGPVALPPPPGVELVSVTSAEEMHAAVEAWRGRADVFIGAAAVADWRPAQRAEHKLKKGDDQRMTLELVRTPDIIASVAQWQPRPVVVGFAAETEDLLAHAAEKLRKKGLDLVVANDVTASGAGFGSDTNRAVVLDATGGVEELGLMSKSELARRILERIEGVLASR